MPSGFERRSIDPMVSDRKGTRSHDEPNLGHAHFPDRQHGRLQRPRAMEIPHPVAVLRASRWKSLARRRQLAAGSVRAERNRALARALARAHRLHVVPGYALEVALRVPERALVLDAADGRTRGL